jgi:glucose-1-phosphate thymidylyltransferase
VKGIILAGGSGTRLYPVTRGLSKQLLPVYNKPMIYYPLSVLMLAGVREILIITTPDDAGQFKDVLGDGAAWGLSLSYEIQYEPNGLPEAFIIGEKFIGSDSAALILGDNIFYGDGFAEMLQRETRNLQGCVVFGQRVKDPERMGVGEVDESGRLIGVEEKPKHPRSDLAITGMYFCDNRVVGIAKAARPSHRGETEIVDVIRAYIELGQAKLVDLGRGFTWLDTGTHESMMEASSFIQVVEHRQGLRIACLEEIALRMGFISRDECLELARQMGDSEYASYIVEVAEQF